MLVVVGLPCTDWSVWEGCCLSKLFFETALLADGWASDVLVEIGADGRFSTVTAGAAPGEALRHGIAVPGMANLHGHAFQRGMAGLAEVAGAGEDSFWTWREVMYRFLERLGPEDVEAIAALAYVEMLESGFTAAAEFHYLHHAPDGRAYANPAELSLRVIAAADATGIAFTHLPVLYAQSDFGGVPPASGQRRFVHDLDGFRHLVEALERQLPRSDVFRLGIAPHSLRAVTPESLVALVQAFPGRPVHIHVAEQEREVEACLYIPGPDGPLGLRPAPERRAGRAGLEELRRVPGTRFRRGRLLRGRALRPGGSPE